MTKTDSVLSAFRNGDELTAAQIRTRFGAGNPGQIISSLREQGHAIYLNDSKNSKGETLSKYRLGKPSRKMVQAAYAVLGGAVFDSRAV
jgi:ribonucleotide monophosphatase NagD (HAD superfamily)